MADYKALLSVFSKDRVGLISLVTGHLFDKGVNLDDVDTPPTEVTHHIHCEGPDQPGVLARLSEVFIDFDANIVRLKSDQVEQEGKKKFITRFSVYIPETRVNNCLAALGNTASALGQTLSAEAADEE